MSKPFKINEELSIYVVTDEGDSLLTRNFYKSLYDNVFSDNKNNSKAGLLRMDSMDDVVLQIRS